MDWNNVSVGLVIAIVLGVEQLVKWVIKYFNKAYKAKKNSEDFHETVSSHTIEIKNMKISQIALNNGMQILLKENLKKLHKEYMERGSITSDELDDFTFQYNTYHSLGGNGTGTTYMNHIKALPIID
ncbi:MAG: hypothetical protein K0S41_4327 [Anaerocolumna sp.]|jgi:hypothetical protein|nr:hypothetical protein [Anaerocolumna sp.]